MPVPLLKKRTLHFPTWQGGLLLLSLFVLFLFLFSRTITPFLAVNDPLDPDEYPKIDLLVIEGWAPDFTYERVAAEFQTGRYGKLASTGGHIPVGERMVGYANYAAYGGANLELYGIAPEDILTARARDTDKHRTYENALGLRDRLAEEKLSVRSIQIITTSIHARRTRLAHRRAFGPDMPLGIIAFDPFPEDTRHWWRRSDTAKAVISETIAYVHDRFLSP
jgi:hypothetical protein